MNVVKLIPGDIQIDIPLPWSVYDSTDYLLFKQGHVFESEKKIWEIIERGAYRDHDSDIGSQVAAYEHQDNFDNTRSPFYLVNHCADRLGEILEHIEDGNLEISQYVIRLAHDIMWLCDRDMEAAFAIFHIPATHKKYSLYHPVHVALLSSVLAMRMNINDQRRTSLVAAALTANVGMRNFQEVLQRQCLEITDKQRELIKKHPLTSVRILKAAGVGDQLWLNVVSQHHEQVDGGGYPKGLSGDEVLIEASIISISDCYTAMMSKRADRKAVNVKDTLREFFTEKGNAYTESLAVQLVKELGIYPPGTFVRLANNEQSIVVKRFVGRSNTPIVKSVVGADGELLPTPIVRDTSNKTYQIMESILLPKGIKINYEKIWGYS